MWMWWLQSAEDLRCGLHSQSRQGSFSGTFMQHLLLCVVLISPGSWRPHCSVGPTVQLYQVVHALPRVTSKSDLYWLNSSSIITGSCMCRATVGNPSGIPSSRCFIWVYGYWSLIFRVSLWGSTTPFLIEDSVLIFYLKLRACYYSAFNILIHT